jgi:excisionase family DNA binding protein
MTQRRPNQVDMLLSIADVAKRCVVSTRTVRRWIEDSGLPIFRPGKGRLIRISERDLVAFINRGRIYSISARTKYHRGLNKIKASQWTLTNVS